MIFIGPPNQYVRFSSKLIIRLTGKKGFYFDENGKHETDNDLLCRVLKQHFEVEEIKEIKEIEEAKEVNEVNSVTDDKPIEEKTFKCKKCSYETENRGELLAHYRNHKKEV